MPNASPPFPMMDPAGDDAMVVEDATSGTHPAPQTQQRKAQAVRARAAHANLIASWESAEEDAEAAIRWTQRTLQGQSARDAMTASLDLWMWPSDGHDSEGHPDGDHGLHATMFDPVGGLQAAGSAGGDNHAEIAILGESRARSHSPCDAAIHTMPGADVPSSRPVRGEPALRGGVEGEPWESQDSGNSGALDSATDMAGASAGARSGVGGLGSGQPADEGGQGPGGSGVPAAAALTPAVHGATARDHADDPNGGSAPPTGVDTASEACPHSDDAAMNLVREAPEVLAQTACATGGEGADEDAFLQASVLGSVPFVHTMPDAERALDSVPDMAGAGADGHPRRFASSKQRRAWLRDQKRKGRP
jgi:hypothetical protein